MTTKTTTKSGKRVKIETYTVGQNFGTSARIRSRGKTLWDSRTYPLGMTGPALAAAVAALETL